MLTSTYFSAPAHAVYMSWYQQGREDRQLGHPYRHPHKEDPGLSDDALIGYDDGYLLREPAKLEV